MQKQAAFSLVMSTMPEYLILDEPIDGLDPIIRKMVWKYIVEDVAEREMTAWEAGALRAVLSVAGQATDGRALLRPYFPRTELFLLEPLAVCKPPAPKPSTRTPGA